MFCQNCGADISNSGVKFCRSCGTELNSITKANTSTGGQSLTICDSFQSFIKRQICNEHRSVICHNKLIV